MANVNRLKIVYHVVVYTEINNITPGYGIFQYYICLYSRTAKQRTITFILISMNNEIIVPETKRTKYEAVK